MSPAFTKHCSLIFERHDADKSGYLEADHEAGTIAAAVLDVLPEQFLDRLDGIRAESLALSFDSDWDGKMSREEFVSFVRWASAMHARGFFKGQAPFEVVGKGKGDSLLVVSEYMDEDGTLHEAVKSSVDLALYHPSAITLAEFSQQLAAAGQSRKRKGLQPYKTVGLANHGPDEKGKWYPFAGKALRLTRQADVEQLLPVLKALAALLPQGGGGRLDLMACNLASVPGGMDLIRRLEKETGHTVCASSDCTGNAEHGGNWTMEVGNVNVAPTYFDEEKLKHFERLMAMHHTGAAIHHEKSATKHIAKVCVANSHATEAESDDDDDDE